MVMSGNPSGTVNTTNGERSVKVLSTHFKNSWDARLRGHDAVFCAATHKWGVMAAKAGIPFLLMPPPFPSCLRNQGPFAITTPKFCVRIQVFEEIGVLYRGLMLGLMIAAPVGPIGLLCIRRTVRKGFPIGFTTGLGAACADTVFGAIAAFGVSVILDFMHHYDLFIRILGGAFLLVVAWHTWHDQPRKPKQDAGVSGVLKAVISGFAITVTNPATLVGTLAVVATFGALQGRADAATLVGGIFLGSTLWWLILAGGVALVREHFTETRVIWINRITGVVLAVLAFWAVVSGVRLFIRG
jgi:threonine/homoserine/homoserine lactone efflux protein